MIRVIVVEDQAMLRDSLALAINAQEDMQVVAVLADASECLDAAKRHEPDVLLLDVCTENGSSGIVAARQAKEALPGVRCVVMTGMPELTFIEQAKRANVDSFVYKNIGTDELIRTIRSTMDGYSSYPIVEPKDAGLASLTPDEVQILRMVCEGMSRKQMAAALYKSEGTLKRTISEILAKTGYDNLTKLAVHAITDGYIVPNVSQSE